MENLYEENYYKQSRLSNLYSSLFSFSVYKKIAAEKINKPGRILDVGCGNGGLLLLFKTRGWETHGVEPSESGFAIANNKIGETIHNCTLDNYIFPANYFDIVVVNHVLEHIAEPKKTMLEIKRVLKPNGNLHIEVPDAGTNQYRFTESKWYHFDGPRHVHQYTTKSLVKLLNIYGFQDIIVHHGFFSYPFDLFQSFRRMLPKPYKVLEGALFVFCFGLRLFPSWRGTVEIRAYKEIG